MYMQYYGLQAQPFRLTPDPYFFFNSATHKSALAYMRYGMQQGEGFIVVTGPAGTGKTTLSLTLLGELPRQTMMIGELVTTQLQPEDLLRAIASTFQLNAGGTKSELIVRLQRFFNAHTHAGKHVLLVVDEAHDLPQASFEELRMLSNFHRGPQALLQCILLGQEPLRDMLARTNMEQFQQRVIAAHHLHPLSPNETWGYILHRLQQAGWHGKPSFTAEAVKLVHQYTQGIPRRINALCNRLMLYGYIEEQHLIDATATIQVYNEWQQELGQMGSVEPLRQAQVEEINFAGLAEEHATLGHAVGADTSAMRVAPGVRAKTTVVARSTATIPSAMHSTATTNVPPKATIPSSSSEVAPEISAVPRYETPPPALTEHIPQHFVQQVALSSRHYPQPEKPVSGVPWLVLTVTAFTLIAVAVVVFLAVKDPYSNVLALITSSLSHTVDATAPAADFSPRPAHPLQFERTASGKDATPGPDANNSVSVTSPPAMEPGQAAHNTPAVQPPHVAVVNAGIAAAVPPPKVKAPPEPAKQVKVTHRKQTTPRQTKLAPQPGLEATVAVVAANPQQTSGTAIEHTDRTAHESTETTKALPKQTKHAPQPSVAVATTNPQQHSSAAIEHTDHTAHESTETAKALPKQAGLASQPSLDASIIAAIEHTDRSPNERTVTAKALPISKDKLSELLARFRDAYDNGDMDELVQLFASDARSDGDGNREAIARSYRKLFSVTAERHLALKDLHWSSDGDAVQGEGHFGVTVKEKGRNWKSSYAGKISLRIEKRDGQVLITSLNHRDAQ